MKKYEKKYENIVFTWKFAQKVQNLLLDQKRDSPSMYIIIIIIKNSYSFHSFHDSD